MNEKVYFSGLNGVRFLAAICVIFDHLETLKFWFGVGTFSSQSRFILSKIVLNGDDAVTLFFVLSGFLITYLLLVEGRLTGTIHVKDFYARRILRIWPLYYLMVLIGFLGLPLLEAVLRFKSFAPLYNDSPIRIIVKAIEYLLFLPQVGSYFGSFVPGIDQLWSIGVEETFYLAWPVLFRRFLPNILRILIGIIAVKLLIWLIFLLLPTSPSFLKTAFGLITSIRIENMAVGGLGAYILFTKQERLLKIIFHPVTEWIVLILILGNIFFYTGEANQPVNYALSVIYVIFLMNISSNHRSKVKLEHPVLNALGRISYGIYMYHVIVIYLVLMAFHYLHFEDNSILYNVVLYTLSTALTISVAQLSYNRLEKPFLRLKKRFTIVESGEPSVTTTKTDLHSEVPVSL